MIPGPLLFLAQLRARILGAAPRAYSWRRSARELLEDTMVARVWRGYAATQQHADAYEALLKPELLPGISKKPGYRGSHLLRRDAGHEIEFITMLFFETLDDIKAITGPDY